MYRFFSLSILQKKEANKEIITAIPNVDTLPGSRFQEYYISATQSHDKSKAIQYKNRPFQILIFTGFSESQNKVEPYRKKSMFIRVYGILAVKFCTIFVIYLTIYSYTNPLKIRIYTISWSIP